VERYVNTRKGNCSESSLKFDESFCLLLFLGFFEAALSDVTEHLLDFINRELGEELKSDYKNL
jgi:hypothetical protein